MLDRLVWTSMSLAIVCVSAAFAQSPVEWRERVLDPKTIGIEPFAGVELHQKLSVDSIKYDQDGDRIAVYVGELAQLAPASAHFTSELGVEPTVTGKGTQFEIHWFQVEGGGRLSEDVETVIVQVGRSPWITGKLQITIEARPREREAAPAADASR